MRNHLSSDFLYLGQTSVLERDLAERGRKKQLKLFHANFEALYWQCGESELDYQLKTFASLVHIHPLKCANQSLHPSAVAAK